ncbi:hypothetical protein SynBIOSE41_01214 [Synechococcus sp. BIOS-E4-1]|nr:hypothetical protein SynBIOSE41_01214 [Synechococcus sp. BIOS-E4-1]
MTGCFTSIDVLIAFAPVIAAGVVDVLSQPTDLPSVQARG